MVTTHASERFSDDAKRLLFYRYRTSVGSDRVDSRVHF